MQAEEDNTFRDQISTVDKRGKRLWVFPKKPKGKFTSTRTVVSMVLLVLLFAGPFIYIDGQPLLMLNILERKFVIFGKIFWPQDFPIFAIGMITMIVFITLFTVVFGRLFCGWVCPQTIFMEFVFRKIEYWIDGDYKQQMALRRSPMTGVKLRKRILKHTIFYLISFLIGNIFLAYIIGSEQLIDMITAGPAAEAGAFVALAIFSTLFYFVFSWMREQVCTVVCPYGRLQGVLLDKKSIVVAYDHVRGEPRGKIRKNEERSSVGKGDCIDCNQCVVVCPTGIDIRNGTQLECTNCTACIDACNSMMDAVNLPKGLIRYASESEITEKKKFRFTGRMKAYTGLLTGLVALLVVLLVTRTDIDATVTRVKGTTFNKMADGRYNNLYDIKVINKTTDVMDLDIRLKDGSVGELKMIGSELEIPEQGEVEGRFMIILPKKDITALETDIELEILGDGEVIKTVTAKFLGPV